MTDIAKLAYFGAYGDRERWRAFASDIHGLQATELGNKLCFRMDEKLWRIAIEPDRDRGCAYLGLETSDDQFETLVGRLRERGPVEIDPSLARERRVAKLARFIGPGEIVMELVSGLMDADMPFASPLGTRFVTGNAGMGHYGISVADPDEAAEFYREVLGFRLTDAIVNEPRPEQNEGGTTYFYRGGRRHHTVAILSIPGLIGVHHVFVEGASMQSVGRAWDKIDAGGARVMMTLGQHLNDPAISYYCLNPSRFGFEFGWDSMTIDNDDEWQPKLWNNGFTWGHKVMLGPPKQPAVNPG